GARARRRAPASRPARGARRRPAARAPLARQRARAGRPPLARRRARVGRPRAGRRPARRQLAARRPAARHGVARSKAQRPPERKRRAPLTRGPSRCRHDPVLMATTQLNTDRAAALALGEALRGVGYSERRVSDLLGEDAYDGGREEAPVAERRLPRTPLAAVVRLLFLQLATPTGDVVGALGRRGVDALEASGLAAVG